MLLERKERRYILGRKKKGNPPKHWKQKLIRYSKPQADGLPSPLSYMKHR